LLQIEGKHNLKQYHSDRLFNVSKSYKNWYSRVE
jgi:hypothetical protein